METLTIRAIAAISIVTLITALSTYILIRVKIPTETTRDLYWKQFKIKLAIFDVVAPVSTAFTLLQIIFEKDIFNKTDILYRAEFTVWLISFVLTSTYSTFRVYDLFLHFKKIPDFLEKHRGSFVLSNTQKLDAVLEFLSTYKTPVTLDAPEICEKSGLDVDNYTAGLIVDKLHDDNCVIRMDEAASRYQPKFNGKLFIDNGGYVLQHKLYRRKKLSQWFSDYFDMLIKPLTVISIISAVSWIVVQVLDKLCLLQ
jgi:hypothetical protein